MHRKKMMDKFITEYLYDHDVVKAAMRCGYDRDSAKQHGHAFMQDKYVMFKLKKFGERNFEDRESEDYDKKLVGRTLRGAMHEAPWSTRVRAAEIMAKLRGMLEVEKNDNGNNNVMIVPAIMTKDEWNASVK